MHRLTGATPTLALHVLWDLPHGLDDISELQALERRTGIRSGSINPNLFQDQQYKFGSLCNPSAEIRESALRHVLDSIEIAKRLRSRDVSLWLADGSNYPGTQSIRNRIEWLEDALRAAHSHLAPDQRLLVEYKPFEPAFYHTDIADWGMSSHLCRVAGPQAFVLVDTGHHYLAQNIEQIVAWLLHLDLLGGFHFNDRRYADDDLTLGSIDPYQVFRIFHELHINQYKGSNRAAAVAFMIDQSHNLKGKDRGDGADRGYGTGIVAEGGACRSRPARGAAGVVRPGCGGRALPGRILARCEADGCRLARISRIADRSAGGLACRRLRGTHHP